MWGIFGQETLQPLATWGQVKSDFRFLLGHLCTEASVPCSSFFIIKVRPLILGSFGHLMRRADSLEKTLMLGKIKGKRRGEGGGRA